MPESLRVKIKKLHYQGIFNDSQTERLLKLLEIEKGKDINVATNDLISRQAVLETIEDCNSDGLKGIFCSYNDGKRFEKYIKDLPSVTPKEKTGHWIRQTDDYHDYYECEHCGIAVGLDDIKNYCPNCGFRMFESQESEDKE